MTAPADRERLIAELRAMIAYAAGVGDTLYVDTLIAACDALASTTPSTPANVPAHPTAAQVAEYVRLFDTDEARNIAAWIVSMWPADTPSTSDEERAKRWLSAPVCGLRDMNSDVPSLASEFAAVAEAARAEAVKTERAKAAKALYQAAAYARSDGCKEDGRLLQFVARRIEKGAYDELRIARGARR